jgi:prepilin-type N-terminal cleavage/methylation domain-containing protein
MKSRYGLTVLELLVTVVIIGVLAAILILRYQGAQEKANIAALQNDLRNYAVAQEEQLANVGTYSTSPAELPGYALSRGVEARLSYQGPGQWYLLLGHAKMDVRCALHGGHAADAVQARSPVCAPSTEMGQTLSFGEDGTMSEFRLNLGVPGPIEAVPDSTTPGRLIARITGRQALEGKVNIPYDPNRLYRVTATIRQAKNPTTTDRAMVYVGLVGVAEDGVTRVNWRGGNTVSEQHYIAVNDFQITESMGWMTFQGYARGHGVRTNYFENFPDPAKPAPLYPGVAYIRPYVVVNEPDSNSDGVADVKDFRIDVIN